MAREFPLVPELVETVSTRHRKLSGTIPNPETIDQIARMRAAEPQSMRGQPPIVWDRAEGCSVFDAYGNQWLDFSSGVLITNAGHGHPRIIAAIRRQIERPLLTTYCFPNQPRIELVEKLASLAPKPGVQGVLAEHRRREHGMRTEVDADLWAATGRNREERHRLLCRRLSWPDAGSPTLGRIAGGQGLDQEPRRGDRPRSLPRRLPLRRYPLRAFRIDAGPEAD